MHGAASDRLLFPTDEFYYSGDTLEALQLVYYACVGDRDGIANQRVMQTRQDTMQQAGIAIEFHVYSGLGHGFGLGTGTSAEGWLDDAAAFREKQM